MSRDGRRPCHHRDLDAGGRGVLALLALAMLLVLAVTGCTSDPAVATKASAPSPPSPTTTPWDTAPPSHVRMPVPMTSSRARQIETGTTSGDIKEVAEVVDLAAGASLDPRFVADLSQLKSAHLNEKSFRQVDDNSAVAQMSTTDAASKVTTWTVTLVLRSGMWRVALTNAEPTP